MEPCSEQVFENSFQLSRDRSSPDVKSVMLRYGLECAAFSIIVMILNLRQVQITVLPG